MMVHPIILHIFFSLIKVNIIKQLAEDPLKKPDISGPDEEEGLSKKKKNKNMLKQKYLQGLKNMASMHYLVCLIGSTRCFSSLCFDYAGRGHSLKHQCWRTPF